MVQVQYGNFIYFCRGDNFIDISSGKIYTKLGETENPRARLRGYNTDKHHPVVYCYLYKILNVPRKTVEDYLKRRTLHLKGIVVLEEKSAGDEIRFATPEELHTIFLDICQIYNIRFKAVDPAKVNDMVFNRLQKTKIKALQQPKISTIQKPFYEPFPHQTEALSKICEEIPRGQIILPTGTGKTFIMIMALQKWLESPQARLLIVVPNLNLIQQTYVQIRTFLPETLHLIVNASDILPFRDDVHLLKNPDDDSLQEEFKRYQKVLIISTYQSSHKLVGLTEQIDLGFFDEAHRTVGEADAAKARLIFDEKVKIQYRRFLTATQRVTRKKKDKASMDLESQYGPVLYHMSLRQAISQNLLVDFLLITTFCNYEIPPLPGKDFSVNEHSYVTASIRYAFSQFDVQKMIVYSNLCQDAKNLQTLLQDYLGKDEGSADIKVFYIDGTTPVSERTKIFTDFQKSGVRSIICSVNTITEGIDLPLANCVCFAQPRTSTLNIIQIIGRILRKHPDKDMSYVLIPSVPGDFTVIKAVFKALAEYDELKHLCKSPPSKKSLSLDKLISQLVNCGGQAVDVMDIEYNKEAIDKACQSIQSKVKGTGIGETKWEVIMDIANRIKNEDNIFSKHDLDACMPELKQRCPNSYGSKTPKASLSRDLQTMDDRGLIHMFYRPSKNRHNKPMQGKYKILVNDNDDNDEQS